MSHKKNGATPDRALRVDLRFPFAICAAGASLILGIVILLSFLPIPHADLISLGLFFGYLLAAGILVIVYAVRYADFREARKFAEKAETDVYRMFRTTVDLPYAIVNSRGHVRVINSAFQTILGWKSPICDTPFSELIPDMSIEEVAAAAYTRNAEHNRSTPSVSLPSEEVDIDDPSSMVVRLCNGRRYHVESYLFPRSDDNYYFIIFRDVNEYLDLLDDVSRNHVVVAYIMLDNLQELTQFVRANYRLTANLIEDKLTEWVSGMNGMLREYDRDKYLAVFSAEMLERCIQDNFPILDEIMQINVGDNSFPVSISMGIADIDGTIRERERAANSALEMALQRGGNQVAIRRRGSGPLLYFGGAHKTLETNTSISSRVSAHLLDKRISVCDHVLIMAHATPDFDAIGSAVGLYRLSRSILESHDRGHVPVHIVTNMTCETFAICRKHLSTLPEYDRVFIDKETARQTVTSSTVLIITDVSNPMIFEAPDLPRLLPVEDGMSPIAVIDHHRLVGGLPFAPFLHYIETTKSSASEIVSEILQQSEHAETLCKEEANLLLAGIMLDTHNFTRAAGSQTFDITYYLYSRNAHTDVAREFFNESISELQIAGDFDAHTELYADIFAFARLSDSHDPAPEDRIAASKAADKMLNIRGVEASFAMALTGTGVSISARSKGRINVQLIMEKLDGGGHFDMAGAQVVGSINDAYEALTAAIDEYRRQFPEQCRTEASND